MATPGDALAQIAADVRGCTLCDLHRLARNGAPGVGAAQAEVILIGEAPSAVDDRRGTPFSGPSGVFLDELLAVAGLNRSSVYLTNIVKHHPPESRALAPDEILACAPYLTREIEAVNPLVIVALGRGAASRFFPRVSITRMHGQARQLGGRIVVAMYNPAAALHQEALRQTVVDDFAHALPAALAEARRLAAQGVLRPTASASTDEPPPEQLSLF